MAKAKTLKLELTLQEAVTLWGYLDARPVGKDAKDAEILRWMRDRLAKTFAAVVDTNIESEAKAVR